jgi:Domain of unknown function (DUF4868)
VKSIDEIREAFQLATANGINFELFLGTGDRDSRIYQKADISDNTTASICRSYIESIRLFFANDELSTRELSRIDSRDSALWFYDLAESPSDLTAVSTVLNGAGDEIFSFNTNTIADIKSMVVRISSSAKQIAFYKNVYPVSIIKRDQVLLYPLETRLEIIDKDMLKLTHGFDVVCVDDEFYINNFKMFEKSFGFDEIARRTMQRVSDRILATALVNDSKGYIARLEIPKRESIRADTSRVLDLPGADIIAFAQSKHAKIGLTIDNNQIQITSKASAKKLFKLLNDDYLTSELTHVDYESQAKDEI